MDFSGKTNLIFPTFTTFIGFACCVLVFDMVFQTLWIILLFITSFQDSWTYVVCSLLWQVPFRYPIVFPICTLVKEAAQKLFFVETVWLMKWLKGMAISCICSWFCTCLSHLYPSWKVGWPCSLRPEGLADERGLSASCICNLYLNLYLYFYL